ncbi:MAG: hypothetical protein ACK4F5_05155 [Aliihoeflea sp.]|jgi:uncharacterized membrane protein
MALGRFLEYLVDNRRILAWIMYGVLALLVVLDFLIPSGYDRFWWESVGGFGAIYGFISCTLIIVVSKALGKVFLNRPEDYYDD